MSEKGQSVVPKEIRDQRGYRQGSVFAVLETKQGDLILRPMRTEPKQDLVDHLLRLKGLEIPEMHFHCPPRV